MVVTGIVPVTSSRYKIFLGGEFAFVLYKGELSRFHIEEGRILSEEEYEQLEKRVLKRIKLRAMHLLNVMPRTEEQLKTKLRQSHYTDVYIEAAIEYVKSYGYINDTLYAQNFAESRKHSKSKKEVMTSLLSKGVNKQIIENVLLEVYSDADAKEAIQKLLQKKRFDVKEADQKDKSKMYRYLAQKGFSYEDIRQVIQVSSWDA